MIVLRATLIAALVAFDSFSLSLSEQTCVAEHSVGEVPCTADAAVTDQHGGNICKIKVENGECNSNQEFMFENCAYACLSDDSLGSVGYFASSSNVTDKVNGSGRLSKLSSWVTGGESDNECADLKDECLEWAEDGDCNSNPQFMLMNCAKTCMICFSPDTKTFEIGINQEIPPEHINDSSFIESTLDVISQTSSYMAKVMTEDEFVFKQVRYECRNADEHCAALAVEGYCEEPGEEEEEDYTELYEFMITKCAPACQACDELAYTDDDMILKYCSPDRDTDVFESHELDEMFLRLVGELPFEKDVPNFVSKIHSRPSLPEGTSEDDVDYHIDGPWIVTLDNFLTDEECDTLIKLGADEGYERSYLNEDKDYDEEQLKKEYESEDAYRTSTNSWCMDDCYEHPIAKRVIEKIENTTGVPDAYSEYLQLLKYVPGQYYKVHHDYITDSEHYPQGPRILTFFLYLNDVEEGGATRFSDIYGDGSDIQIDVQPKKGTALVWPSVLSHDLNDARDERTYHEALPVVKGMKFGANAWLHLRNVKDDDCDYDAYYEILRREGIVESEDDEEEYEDEDGEEEYEDEDDEEEYEDAEEEYEDAEDGDEYDEE